MASVWNSTNESEIAWKSVNRWPRFTTIATHNLPKRKYSLPAAISLAKRLRRKNHHWCAGSLARRTIAGGWLMGRWTGVLVLRANDPAHQWWFFLRRDRKSTRLNSSHQIISYAVFCLKK